MLEGALLHWPRVHRGHRANHSPKTFREFVRSRPAPRQRTKGCAEGDSRATVLGGDERNKAFVKLCQMVQILLAYVLPS